MQFFDALGITRWRQRTPELMPKFEAALTDLKITELTSATPNSMMLILEERLKKTDETLLRGILKTLSTRLEDCSHWQINPDSKRLLLDEIKHYSPKGVLIFSNQMMQALPSSESYCQWQQTHPIITAPSLHSLSQNKQAKNLLWQLLKAYLIKVPSRFEC